MSEQAQLKRNEFNTESIPYSKRDCPICERGKFSYLLSNVDRVYFDKSRIFDFYKCDNCSYVELDCNRDFETISSFYPSSDYYSYQDQSKFIGLKISLFKLFFRKVNPLLSILRDILTFPVKQGVRSIEIVPGGKLFDVGCGSGKFLRIAKGLGMKPYGLDIDPKACEAAKKVSPDIACEVTEHFKGFFEGSDKVLFDVITANHVIEHALDPSEFLSSISSSLKSDGLIIIGTPNIGSPIATIFGKYWLGLETPRHLSLFTPANFTKLCEKLGLKVKKVRHTFNGYSMVVSSLFILEEALGKKFSDTSRNRAALLGKFVLFPFCMLINLLGMSDQVDYYIQKS